ncbi:acyl-CoA Delta-9 desaturase [Diabrotica undecimpunctata]|uniref:acyl-CoA Delta-9 desaturase n=1 Tax=Diabrotica undecimpunctata TaxID=50387 RepID=UPI003B63A874
MSTTVTQTVVKEEDAKLSKTRDVNWMKVLFQLQITLMSLCAIHFILYDLQWKTLFFMLALVLLGQLGVTAGAHRLWAHNTYSADGILRGFLIFCQTLSGTGSVYEWVQWHRLHHKYFQTDLDPYNPSRGWFYAHIQSTTLHLSQAQEAELKKIDMSDLENDKLVMWQKKYYIVLYLIVTLLLPINAPAEYWEEGLYSSVFVLGFLRGFINLNLAWLINSAIRIWGLKKGEKFPCDTNLVFILNKSNWLAYHYIAPWDYQVSEYGQYGKDTISKIIRIFEVLECASTLKTIDSDTVRKALTNSVVQKRDITECLEELCDYSQKAPVFS